MIHNAKTAQIRTLPGKRQRHAVVRRVREILRAQIVDGGFRDGVLPGEFELVKEYGVSRGVIRDVLALLRGEGLIERQQGAGTFVVAQERSPVAIHTAQTLAEGLERGQSRVSWELLDVARLPVPPQIAGRLEIAPGDDVVFVERLTVLDAQPLMLRSSWFPLAVGAPLLEPGTDFRFSVYDLVEQVLGHEVAYARLRVEAVKADSSVAPALDIDVGAPVQLMERLVYGVDERPLECSFARASGDRFVLTTVMPRQRSAEPENLATTRREG